MIVATDDVLTVVVEIANVALVAPAATVTLPGTVAAALLLESVTANPPDAAADVSVTVPCAALPPVTVEGLNEIAESAGDEGGGGGGGGGAAEALTVSDRAALSRSRAEIVMAVSDVTDEVVIGNVAEATPAGTVTFAGTRAAAFELKSWTTAPPAGAALWSVTVPLDDSPPLTIAGESVTSTTGGVELVDGFTVNVRLAALDPYDADSDTGVDAGTDLLVTNANDADVEPPNTVTLAGSDEKSSGWFEEMVNRIGAGAADPRLMVATPPWPPLSVVTFAVSDDTVTPVVAATLSTPLNAVPSKYAVSVTLREVGEPRVKIRNA